MPNRVWFALVGLGMAAAVSAQQFQVGSLPGSPDFVIPPQSPYTVFDMSVASSTSGYLTSATFAYSAFPCPAAVNIQILREEVVRFTLFTALGVDGRGPFDVTQRIQTVALVPPLKIQQGDWLGISSRTDCGHPLGTSGPGKITVANPIYPISALPEISGATLYLAASGTRAFFTEVSGTIPVVFTGDGAASSHFRTEALLHNPTSGPISGSLSFVPSRSPVQTPYIKPYSLAPFEVQSVDLPGFGSVDIRPAIFPGPAAFVRVFNDAGPSGTVGFAESELPPTDALASGDAGVLIGPLDPTNFRFNIGIRSLDIPAAVVITARKTDGTLLGSVGLSGVVGLQQMSFEEIFGRPLDPGVSVRIQVTSGSVIGYGVSADNRTNDSSLQLAKRISGSGM
jgi:hypothetical protein